MHEAGFGSAWDTLLFAIPFLLLLVFGFFRLDEVYTAHKRPGSKARRGPSGVDEDGMPILSDPDGRVWTVPKLRQ